MGTVDGAFNTDSDAMRDQGYKYRDEVVGNLERVQGAMSIVQAGNPDMYGPLLNGLGIPADLDESFQKVADVMKRLAAFAGDVPVDLFAAADAYDRTEARNTKAAKDLSDGDLARIDNTVDRFLGSRQASHDRWRGTGL